jgi:diadenosine tetraphosphatase ApaH/serine/threonine PP2A family protein phosphatase
MRVAVISDIHANLHALEAVREAIQQEAPDEIWCLGDLVGYGPQPNPCCEWTAEHASVCLAGNHDLGVLGALDIGDFSEDAATAAIWTRGVLTEAAHDYLAALPPSGEREGVGLFHASPRDPVWEYVLSWEAADAAIRDSPFQITLVGHSHVPLAIGDDPDEGGGHAPGGSEIDLTGGRWLLNPGSVGQPRDGDPAAAWLLLDLDEGRASFLRVPYDVERTQSEIRDRGLPDVLAERLAHGV